jgi:hypothetical protein
MAEGSNDFSLLRFSTAALPEHDRIAVWHDVYARHMLRVDVEQLSDDPLDIDATMRALPGLRTTSFTTSPTMDRRTRSTLAGRLNRGLNALHLVANERNFRLVSGQ